MRILITGGNGFVGSHLAESLIKQGKSVSLFDLRFTSNTSSLPCEKIQGDVTRHKDISEAVSYVDVVFHLGAVSRVITGQKKPRECFETNVLGTVNVLEACRTSGNDKIIFYASSREVYGDSKNTLVREDHSKNPKSIYGVSKLGAELACLQYRKSFGTKVVILRFSNVYGSERDLMDRVTPKFIINAMKNKEITLYGGKQILDFNFIDDTISGVLCAYKKTLESENETLGQDFHLVSGRGVSIEDLANMIIQMCNSSSKVVRREPRGFEIESFVGDPTKACRVLGYRSKTPLKKGLEILRDRLENRLAEKK